MINHDDESAGSKERIKALDQGDLKDPASKHDEHTKPTAHGAKIPFL